VSPRSSSEGDGDDFDDASMKSMRSVWLSMRDEEPPVGGMAELLAAARAKAETMKPPSWWQRALVAMRRPPALAFATVLVLVGGAVLVGQRTKDQAVDATTAPAVQPATTEMPAAPVAAPDETQQPATLAAPPAERASGAAGLEAAPEAAPVPATPNTNTNADVDAVAKDRRGGRRRITEERHGEPSAGPTVGRTSGDPGAGTAAGPSSGATADASRTPAGAARPRPTVRTTPAVPERSKLEAPTKEAATPPLGEPEPIDEPADAPAADSTESIVISDGGKPRTPPLDQLAHQAASAAARGDCPAVRVIAARIKRQDATFYKTRIAGNAAIAKCL